VLGLGTCGIPCRFGWIGLLISMGAAVEVFFGDCLGQSRQHVNLGFIAIELLQFLRVSLQRHVAQLGQLLPCELNIGSLQFIPHAAASALTRAVLRLLLRSSKRVATRKPARTKIYHKHGSPASGENSCAYDVLGHPSPETSLAVRRDADCKRGVPLLFGKPDIECLSYPRVLIAGRAVYVVCCPHSARRVCRRVFFLPTQQRDFLSSPLDQKVYGVFWRILEGTRYVKHNYL
jgi:hypothetical protein